jgi:hypothetical protein
MDRKLNRKGFCERKKTRVYFVCEIEEERDDEVIIGNWVWVVKY